MSAMTLWVRDIWDAISTTAIGMHITWRHLFTRKVTLHYPEEKWELPPKSRMRLFLAYEDCIGCGQCARACPVNCIHIVAEKRAPGAAPIYAANGQAIKLDVKVFDIDMSLCCYCNLCTYPCPTDCIYMTPEYEFATDDLTQHLYRFAKKDAKFLTVNPKPPAAAPAAAAGAAAAPAAAAAPKPAATAAAPAAAAPKPAAAAASPAPASTAAPVAAPAATPAAAPTATPAAAPAPAEAKAEPAEPKAEANPAPPVAPKPPTPPAAPVAPAAESKPDEPKS